MFQRPKGSNGDLIITRDGVTIRRGLKGFVRSLTVRGEKQIPFRHITSVQYHKSGVTMGYLQVATTGGSEANGGRLQATGDENTVTFVGRNANEEFARARDLILERITAVESAPTTRGRDGDVFVGGGRCLTAPSPYRQRVRHGGVMASHDVRSRTPFVHST